jgi:glycosyltransferase involved in cell wall biosynthesis
MKIGIFVVTPGRKGGGPETYEIGLLRALARVDSRNEYFIYCTHPGAIKAVAIDQPNFVFRILQPSSRWVSLPVTLPLMLLKDGVDFFHATMVPPPWSATPLALTILCSSNWTHPEFYKRAVVRRLNALLSLGIKKADYLLCISRVLLNEVAERFKFPEARLRVSYMGVGPEFFPTDKQTAKETLGEKHGIKYPFALFIGQQQERKNIFRAIEAYAHFKKRTGAETRLLIVGREADHAGPIYDAIKAHGMLDHVTRLRYIPFLDLPILYNAADMLLFPSLWEGFGLPIIESMACGTPVVTSRATCLPEIAGDAAIVADPYSSEEIGDGMVRIHTEPDLRQTLITRGLERAKLFTWERCAESTLEVYSRMPRGVLHRTAHV